MATSAWAAISTAAAAAQEKEETASTAAKTETKLDTKAGTKKRPAPEAASAETAPKKTRVDLDAIDWKPLVKTLLKESAEKKMKVKKLGQRLRKSAEIPDADADVFFAKFKEQLPYISKVVLSDDGKYASLKKKEKAEE